MSNSTYETDGILSTALRSGRAVSPITAETNGSLFGLEYSGTLSTDVRINDGDPGAGSWAPFIALRNANESCENRTHFV